MKRLMNVIIPAAMALFAGTQAMAQKANPVRLGVGINAGIATNKTAGFVLGGDLRLQQSMGKSVSWTLTPGYTHFFKKDLFAGAGVVPVKAGLKFFPAPNFYLAAEAGAGFFTDKGLGTSFVYSPYAGFAFKNLDVSVKYENFTKYEFTQQVALRLAYGFKL